MRLTDRQLKLQRSTEGEKLIPQLPFSSSTPEEPSPSRNLASLSSLRSNFVKESLISLFNPIFSGHHVGACSKVKDDELKENFDTKKKAEINEGKKKIMYTDNNEVYAPKAPMKNGGLRIREPNDVAVKVGL
ncbi:hypothetical protein GIB67_023879 [Kingdonia uniflora]|uniref:Uncharacterized protein n=1 Tax=Kingdonia uniflora TaxID=39325 RepID=A0A7J7NG05_9MAGN|nr:hypothetical protein GIB67_023879 [Kingdonia uniflora]